MKNIFVIVPSLDPEENIMESFIKELQKEFVNILVINDGSKKEHDIFYNKLKKQGIEVFKHYKNYGKGRAIKNAFNYLLNKYDNLEGVVTCDCDGQHSVKDVKKIVNILLKNKDKLILGVRNFNKSNVPKRSLFGNKITKNIFEIFVGLNISDTQTGLRALSKELMIKFLDLNGERYEYESNMLIACQKENIKILEVEIETIYLNKNKNSHFNPLKDSLKIYHLFLRYFLIAFSVFLLDIILFKSLFDIIEINSKILAATILARIISSMYYYIVNYSLIFKNMNLKILIKYYLLVIIQMFLSGCFVTYIANLWNINIIIIKILVDLIIWFINIIILKEFVYNEE